MSELVGGAWCHWDRVPAYELVRTKSVEKWVTNKYYKGRCSGVCIVNVQQTCMLIDDENGGIFAGSSLQISRDLYKRGKMSYSGEKKIDEGSSPPFFTTKKNLLWTLKQRQSILIGAVKKHRRTKEPSWHNYHFHPWQGV